MDYIYNPCHHCLTQSRQRLLALGIRKDAHCSGRNFSNLDSFPTPLCPTLEDMLDSRDDRGDPESTWLLSGSISADSVTKAREVARRMGLQSGWLIAQHAGQ